MLKKLYALLMLLLFKGFLVAATLNYSFTAFAGTYTANSSPTTITEIFWGADDELSAPYNIGFSFSFGGSAYTKLEVSSNGWITFNSYAFVSNNPTSDPVNNLATNATMRPGIAPLWDDLAFNANFPPQASIQTTGIAPNRVCTIQWTEANWKNTASPVSPGEIDFQVKLYETTNVIDFVYNQEAGTVSAGASASIGLAGPSSGDYYSLPNTGTAPVPSKTTETASLNAKPATGQVYRWTPVGVLPVERTSFSVENIGQQNLVQWSTATETNNNYFTVERSSNGTQFDPIIKVKGAGNSTSPLAYKAYDDAPLNGINYYRLKQTDFDGNYTYSNIISVFVIGKEDFNIYPNPVGTTLNVSFTANQACTMPLTIIDITGNIITTGNYAVVVGNNILQVDAQRLAPGVYILKASAANGTVYYRKFVKQ